MKITHVECWSVWVPAPQSAFSWRRGIPGSPDAGARGVLRIGTDTGATGVAYASRPGSAVQLQDAVDRLLRDELVGQDPLQREWLWHRLWELDRIEEFNLPLLGLVDVALWDLAGRIHDEPVWQLLGGFRTELPAYASTSTFRDVSEYLDVADQCIQLGYKAIKLHAWGDAREDARLSLALREHVGPEIGLMYDGSAAFDLVDARYLGHALSDAGFLWYEEPMREFSITAYSQLAKSVEVPLLVAETSDGAHMNSADFIRSGAATWGIRASTGLRVGFTGAMRAAHLADSFLLRAEVHGNDVTSRHLCMAISNTTYFESMVTSNPVRRESAVDARGFLSAPIGPGVSLPAGGEYPVELREYVTE